MKKVIIPTVAVVLLGGSYFAVSHAYAQSTPFSGLAQAIAQKFNLNQSDVQSTISLWHSQQKTKMDQKMQDRLNTKLDQAVKNGKITETQKQAIITKLQELKNNFNATNFKGMTPDQKRKYISDQKSSLESWASSQGIDLKTLSSLFIFPRLGFMRYMRQ